MKRKDLVNHNLIPLESYLPIDEIKTRDGVGQRRAREPVLPFPLALAAGAYGSRQG